MPNEKITDKDVTGQMIWEKAKSEYPILSKQPIDFAFRPDDIKPYGMMESYPVGETQRPKQFPISRFGVAVFDPKATPKDILGDVVSHYLVNADPKVKEYYSQFQGASNTPEAKAALQNLYQEAVQTQGERRPYEEWLRMSGMPGYLRGYTVDQFAPSEIPKFYSKDQIKILDSLREYLGIK